MTNRIFPQGHTPNVPAAAQQPGVMQRMKPGYVFERSGRPNPSWKMHPGHGFIKITGISGVIVEQQVAETRRDELQAQFIPDIPNSRNVGAPRYFSRT